MLIWFYFYQRQLRRSDNSIVNDLSSFGNLQPVKKIIIYWKSFFFFKKKSVSRLPTVHLSNSRMLFLNFVKTTTKKKSKFPQKKKSDVEEVRGNRTDERFVDRQRINRVAQTLHNIVAMLSRVWFVTFIHWFLDWWLFDWLIDWITGRASRTISFGNTSGTLNCCLFC